MSWVDNYKQKLVTAAEAVQIIQSGDRVYYGISATGSLLVNGRFWPDAGSRMTTELTTAGLEGLETIGLDTEATELFLHENARRVFKIGAAA